MDKEKQTQQDYNFSKMEEQILQDIQCGEIPSVAIAIAKNGKIIYENAYGYADIENQVKASIHTSYQLASVSKTMTATGMMMLHQKSGFDIYAPVERYMAPLQFKHFEGNPSEVRTIDLLSHTSGLGTYMQINYGDERVEQDSFETAFQKYGILFHPAGQKNEYSNLGYGLLDYLIEKQSGKSFASFMEDELFTPLKMDNTFVDSSRKETISVAKKYDAELKLLPHVINNTKGAGNIYGSVHDLILFGMFHLKNSPNELLDHQTIDFMHSYINKRTLYHYYDSAYYGLGWYFKPNDHGYKVVWHEGGMMGASSMIKLIPEENIAIAVILNTSNQQYCQKITTQLSEMILPEYHQTPFNEIAEYQPYMANEQFIGNWNGTIHVSELEIPCTLSFLQDGTIMIEYLDFTYESYFTQNSPLFHKTFLLTGFINKESFIGMYLGDLPSSDIRHEFSQLMSLKLYRKGNILSGTVVALAAAQREYYAYPYYIRLERE